MKSHTDTLAIPSSANDDCARQSELERLCHNYRNLLHAIRASTEMMGAATEDERHSLIADIDNAVGCMLEIANDSLDRCRMNRGDHIPPVKPFSVAVRVRDLVSLFGRTATSNGINLLVKIDEAIPNLVNGSGLLVTEIVSNFLSNAYKYSPRGGTISVQVDLVRAPATIRISVQDEGAGIPEDGQRKLFQPYSQLAGAKPGSGLGLCLCKTMAEEVGGSVGVSSIVGVGSTFFVTLPFRPAESAPVLEFAAPDFHLRGELLGSAGLSTGRKVLFVDDELTSLQAARFAFGKHGCTTECASDLPSALLLAEEHAFDLILVDEGLDGSSGLDLVRMLREANLDAKIVGMSGSDYATQFLAAGANHFLLKPYSLKVLGKLLEPIAA